MSFNSSILMPAAACLFITTAALADDKDASSTETFLTQQFSNVPSAGILSITGDARRVASDIIGQGWKQTEVLYWEDMAKTALILKAQAKSGEITAGFALADGRIADVHILQYMASRGKAVRSSAFTGQFKGASLNQKMLLDKQIDGITGATISVNTVKNLARLALYFEQLIKALQKAAKTDELSEAKTNSLNRTAP